MVFLRNMYMATLYKGDNDVIIIIIIITITTTTTTNADLFAEREGFLAAIQDQIILTRNYKSVF